MIRRAGTELRELSQIDRDMNGVIDAQELQQLRTAKISPAQGERLLELFSTHPNMVKRIQKFPPPGNKREYGQFFSNMLNPLPLIGFANLLWSAKKAQRWIAGCAFLLS